MHTHKTHVTDTRAYVYRCVCFYVRPSLILCLNFRTLVPSGINAPKRLSVCVWFTGNGIGDEGAKQLAKSLANNATLTSLDLRGTRWCSVTPAFV